nr:histone-lysine N-methyltransferase ash1 isoform X2 [Hydra vulgaris]
MTSVEDSKYGKALVATSHIKAGEEILTLNGEIVTEPSVYSVQISENEHVNTDGNLRFANHKCRSANAAFDFTTVPWVLKAVRNIEPNEFISFDYNTTEYKISSTFDCICDSNECRGKALGFHYLSDDEKADMVAKGLCSPALQKLFLNEK